MFPPGPPGPPYGALCTKGLLPFPPSSPGASIPLFLPCPEGSVSHFHRESSPVLNPQAWVWAQGGQARWALAEQDSGKWEIRGCWHLWGLDI